MIERIVIATHNPSKVERYRIVFEGLVKEISGLKEDFKDKVDEVGSTAEENATIKALFYAKRLGVLVFCEDESLFVDFLPEDRQPGVFVRRIEGKRDATDDELLSYWEGILRDVPAGKRTGRWHVAYCMAAPNDKTYLASRDHPIRFYYPTSKVRWPGWPLSSIQGRDGFGKPQTEFTEVEKRRDQESGNRAIRLKLQELIKELES